MNTVEQIYELVKNLPEKQASEVLDFVEFLNHKAQLNSRSQSQVKIPKGTLTGLRGIAKISGTPPTDEEIREEYTDYLMEKYQ
ncbi:DUF2281 domain-containing protein [Merismopedia glauca]|uniref:DUF2281 domain-containing protein n=1 Tax=Merismopedia glauca CCAP 1448/3 TaxID=1296344 RepID=A0A2T1C685_9CYAN|nr:DUF2281 domain-containing protein [Merismopedia glauca]PSB03668.1 hypothetical protein C7B64_07495 [Merismopedia glauca CCAP 1448/3]